MSSKENNLEIYKNIVIKKISNDAIKIIEECNKLPIFSSTKNKKLRCFSMHHNFCLEHSYNYKEVEKILKDDDENGFNWNDLEKFISIEAKDLVSKASDIIRKSFKEKFGEDILANKEVIMRWTLSQVEARIHSK